jgi:hypothetical protein
MQMNWATFSRCILSMTNSLKFFDGKQNRLFAIKEFKGIFSHIMVTVANWSQGDRGDRNETARIREI